MKQDHDSFLFPNLFIPKALFIHHLSSQSIWFHESTTAAREAYKLVIIHSQVSQGKFQKIRKAWDLMIHNTMTHGIEWYLKNGFHPILILLSYKNKQTG